MRLSPRGLDTPGGGFPGPPAHSRRHCSPCGQRSALSPASHHPAVPAAHLGPLYGRLGALSSSGVASDNVMGLHWGTCPGRASLSNSALNPPRPPALLPCRWPVRKVSSAGTHAADLSFFLSSPRVAGRSGGFLWLPARCRSERPREPTGRALSVKAESFSVTVEGDDALENDVNVTSAP